MAKVILISQFPLPFSGIGSWTKLYENYFNGSAHEIEYIICPQPVRRFRNVSYEIVRSTLLTKIRRRFGKKNYQEYFVPLDKIVSSGGKFIIQVVDNQGIVPHLHKFLIRKKIRSECYIQYFHHGFGPFVNNSKAGAFNKSINELVLLTHDSYKFYKNYYTVLPVKISVLHNGIDTDKFYIPDAATKQKLKESLGIADKTVFIWCSKDRPKKGLEIVLEAWRIINQNRNDIVLLVVGGSRTPVDGVLFLGAVPNDELAKYYQSSDVYLFSTLCHEGFGMTLIEALHCGNYCIASALGGIPEVLQYGRLGMLLENPHFVDSWVAAANQYLADPTSFQMPRELYSTRSWNANMDKLIANAKFAITP